MMQPALSQPQFTGGHLEHGNVAVGGVQAGDAHDSFPVHARAATRSSSRAGNRRRREADAGRTTRNEDGTVGHAGSLIVCAGDLLGSNGWALAWEVHER